MDQAKGHFLELPMDQLVFMDEEQVITITWYLNYYMQNQSILLLMLYTINFTLLLQEPLRKKVQAQYNVMKEVGKYASLSRELKF